MSKACFIPIKSNSTRVKSKNFRELNGKKLYKYIIENCMEADCFDMIFVDTDSDEIKDYCLCDMPSNVFSIHRNPELAKDTANGNDLIIDAQSRHSGYDYYYQCFATAPFLKSETIRQCVERLESSREYDSIFTATEELGWYWLNNQPVNYQPNVLPRSQDANKVLKESTGMYGITKESLLKYKCRIGAKPIQYLVSEIEAIDLDTEEDFLYAEWRMK